ncbi:MAG: RsmB/NOP family class I SAM-dependent RNA methyltransferase [Acidiferrobacteraceae bacterium]
MTRRLGVSYTSACELLGVIRAGTMPADRAMDQYFRAHRTLGPGERGFVANTVYGCLRRLRSLTYRLSPESSDTALVTAYLLTEGGISARVLEREAGVKDAVTIRDRLLERPLEGAPAAVKADLPDWFFERLRRATDGDADLTELAETLKRQASLDLRVNSLKADREEAAKRLLAEGCETVSTPYSPVGLRCQGHFSVFRSGTFRDGWVEVQDEASQLIALCLDPRRHETVVDFCAGAGGKSLHLGALMHNTGVLYAFDTVDTRLERARERLRRAGLHNARLQVIESERDIRLSRLRAKADRVLVDAPCSGSGTWRRNPDLKWRLVPKSLARLIETQRAILEAAAALVKTGGSLLYATCSLLPDENESVIGSFLDRHREFRGAPLQEVLDRRGIALRADGPFLRLLPHRHQTDGFFLALMVRDVSGGGATG